MPRTNIIESIVGFFVIIVMICIGFFALNKLPNGSKINDTCYTVSAFFSNVEGLNLGDEVKISGIKIGNITSILLESDYTPKVQMCINKGFTLPKDSLATITSSNLLERKYINISPGSDSMLISNNGLIENTHSDISFSMLIAKVINAMIK